MTNQKRAELEGGESWGILLIVILALFAAVSVAVGAPK